MNTHEFGEFMQFVSKMLLGGRAVTETEVDDYRKALKQYDAGLVRQGFYDWFRSDPKAGDWKMYAKLPPVSTWRGYLDAARRRFPTKDEKEAGPYFTPQQRTTGIAMVKLTLAVMMCRMTANRKEMEMPDADPGLVEQAVQLYHDRVECGSEWTPRDFAGMFYEMWPSFSSAVFRELSGQ